MNLTRERHEQEFRVALMEGLVSEEQAAVLWSEARRLDRSPLELLLEQGRLSAETFASLRREALDVASPGTRSSTGIAERSPPPSARPHDPERPEFPLVRQDRYQCERFLGQGGMGRVFLAHDLRLRRDVALKFVRGDDVDLARRFVSEARAQARVSHERVCKVYEVGELEGKVYIAMQYVDGRPLNALASELTVEQKALLIRHVAGGVHEAHRVGLIHRDLKPSNILVERTAEGELKPYVVDFGLAHDWKEGTTATGEVLGTPYYMSPEQARGEVTRLDRRTDVYSLGATLYHLLTGQPPIPGSNGLEVVSRIATVEPRRPRALDADIPADLEAILLKCLEKDRSARYDSARALAADLDRFLEGEPVQARASGLGYRLRKRARKHRLVLTVAATALVLLALAAVQVGAARAEGARRARLTQRFTELVESIEAVARHSSLVPLHDTRADKEALRRRMGELEREIQQAGDLAVGPGHYALGRAWLAVGDQAKAFEYLQAAWRHGYQEPRVAYALALVLGRLYQEKLLEVERIPSRELREARRREVMEGPLRAQALDYLRRGEGASAPEYVGALIAFYEERFDEALRELDRLGGRLPWFYEAPKLRGDIHLARATRHWRHGARQEALAAFAAGREAYAAAAEIGESAPEVHLALADLEHAVLFMENYSKGEDLSALPRGLEAVSRALMAAPDDVDALLRRAQLHRRHAEHRSRRGGDTEKPLQEALADARAALALSPESSKARLEMALIFGQWARYRHNRKEDPTEQLRQARGFLEGIPPEDRDYDFHVHRGLLAKVSADAAGRSSAASLEALGQAIESYLEASRLHPHLSEAWLNLGAAYRSRAAHQQSLDPDGDLTQARAALAKALELNPTHHLVYLYLGRLHEQQARRAQATGGDPRVALTLALEWYQRGLSGSGNLPQLHNSVGEVTLKLAKETWSRGGAPEPLLAQAQGAFETALSLSKEEAQARAYNGLGMVHAWRAFYLQRGQQDSGPSVREAEAAYEKVARLRPKDPRPWTNLSGLHHLMATFNLEHDRDPRPSLEKARQALQEARGRSSLGQDAHLAREFAETLGLQSLWKALRGNGRAEFFEEAARAYEAALGLAPRDADTRLGFGRFCRWWAAWLRGTGRDPDPSLKLGGQQAEEVLAAQPERADALLLRAGLRGALAESARLGEERQGLQTQAEADLRRALEINPHLEPTWRHLLALMRRLEARTDNP